MVRKTVIKKIVIILIIACCLLSFMEISYSNEEPKKYGELWDFFSDIQKCTCILAMDYGITEGINICSMGYMDYFSKREIKREELRQMGIVGLTILSKYLDLRSTLDLEVISKIVTDLYKDPTNTYISIIDIYILALRKLKGEDIEPLLREARKKALLFEKEEERG